MDKMMENLSYYHICTVGKTNEICYENSLSEK